MTASLNISACTSKEFRPDGSHRVLEQPTGRFTTLPGNRAITLESVPDLLASIREEGQLVPGLCYPNPDRADHWCIAAGHRRHFCCDILNIPFKFLPVEGDTSPARMVKLSITENVIRQQLSLLELADQISDSTVSSAAWPRRLSYAEKIDNVSGFAQITHSACRILH